MATTDDGMKYAGDDAQGADKSKVIAKKLNQTLDITGGADSTKLTDKQHRREQRRWQIESSIVQRSELDSIWFLNYW